MSCAKPCHVDCATLSVDGLCRMCASKVVGAAEPPFVFPPGELEHVRHLASFPGYLTNLFARMLDNDSIEVIALINGVGYKNWTVLCDFKKNFFYLFDVATTFSSQLSTEITIDKLMESSDKHGIKVLVIITDSRQMVPGKTTLDADYMVGKLLMLAEDLKVIINK